jgi:PAS domain-containing protein
MSKDRLLQYISDGYLSVDRDWRIVAANAWAEGLLLRHGQPLVGRPLWEVVPDVAGSPAEQEIRAVAAGRVPRRVEHFSASKYIWLEALVVPGGADGAGGCELFMQNVSNRAKVMESEAVRAAVRRILMHAPVAISITRGPEHRYEMVNAAAQGLVGRRDLEGQLARSAFPELATSGLFEILDEVYRTGVPYAGRQVPVRYDREGDGHLVDAVFDFTYQPLLEPDGRAWGIMTVAVEVHDSRDARAPGATSSVPRAAGAAAVEDRAG